MLQSTDKGAQRAHKNSHNFFNERIKMSNDQSNRLNQVTLEIGQLQSKSALNHQDSVSRLSEAIDQFKVRRVQNNSIIDVKRLNTKTSEI